MGAMRAQIVIVTRVSGQQAVQYVFERVAGSPRVNPHRVGQQARIPATDAAIGH